MLAEHLVIGDQGLLEKDVRLHALLRTLASDTQFGPHLAFKGGTCLIKCYLDYPRFSTDLDFTWIDEARALRAPSGSNELRRRLRPTQRELEKWFQQWAEREGYQPDSPAFVHYGRSNRMMTVNLRYPSQSDGTGLIKVQVNFEEPLQFSPVRTEAKSLLRDQLPAEFRLLEGDPGPAYSRAIPVVAYDPREILLEKCRAVLTRTAAKSRDLLDLFLLERDHGLKITDFRAGVLLKTRQAVRCSARYRAQVERFDDREASLLEEDIRPLLLKPVDSAQFQAHRERSVAFLKGLTPEVLA